METATAEAHPAEVSPLACADFLGAWVHGDVGTRGHLMASIEDDETLRNTHGAALELLSLIEARGGDLRPPTRLRRAGGSRVTLSRFAGERVRAGYGAIDGLLTVPRFVRSGGSRDHRARTPAMDTINVSPDSLITFGDSVPTVAKPEPAPLIVRPRPLAVPDNIRGS